MIFAFKQMIISEKQFKIFISRVVFPKIIRYSINIFYSWHANSRINLEASHFFLNSTRRDISKLAFRIKRLRLRLFCFFRFKWRDSFCGGISLDLLRIKIIRVGLKWLHFLANKSLIFSFVCLMIFVQFFN